MITEINPPPNFDPLMADAAAPLPNQHQQVQLGDDSFLAPVESSTITSIDFRDQQMSKSLSPPPPQTQNHHPHHQVVFDDCNSSSNYYDLKATMFTQTHHDSSSREAKRLKPSSGSSASDLVFNRRTASSLPQPQTLSIPTTESSTCPALLVDAQENGVRLVQGLMACA
ncbi:hypothetical protein CerSpe_257870 [Prunus speciosa]